MSGMHRAYIFPIMFCDALMHFGDCLCAQFINMPSSTGVETCVFYLMASVFNFSLFLVYHSTDGGFMLFRQMIVIYPWLRWLICDFMSYEQGCRPSSPDIAIH